MLTQHKDTSTFQEMLLRWFNIQLGPYLSYSAKEVWIGNILMICEVFRFNFKLTSPPKFRLSSFYLVDLLSFLNYTCIDKYQMTQRQVSPNLFWWRVLSWVRVCIYFPLSGSAKWLHSIDMWYRGIISVKLQFFHDLVGDNMIVYV